MQPKRNNNISSTLRRALTHHQAGRLSEAEKLYRHILARQPRSADALQLLGLIAHEAGHHEDAVRLIRQAVEIDDNQAAYHTNLGSALAALGTFDEAVSAYRKAIALEPGSVVAMSNLGEALRQVQQFDDAVAVLRDAVAISPEHAAAHAALGNVLRDDGRPDEAIAAYRTALGTAPESIDIRRRLAQVLRSQGRLAEAEAEVRTALDQKPDDGNTRQLLGLVLFECGEYDAAAECILAPAKGFRSPERLVPHRSNTFRDVTYVKLQHDREQIDYLLKLGHLRGSYESMLTEYQRLLNETPADRVSSLDDFEPPVSQRFADAYNRLLYFAPQPTLLGGTISPSLETSAIESKFRSNIANQVYFDDVLTPAALAGIRRFVLESTIWHQMYTPGELSTSLRNGFCCPLVLQIAGDLRRAFPGVLGGLHLNNCWAYIYYGETPSLARHADDGAVSVNLWLTPDEANLDHESGGLLLWPASASERYFRAGPTGGIAILDELIAETDPSEPIRVPYRCNRAILFRSTTVHATDRVRFRDGFENRRVNVTFLYGDRSKQSR